jgi:hypothetical protein
LDPIADIRHHLFYFCSFYNVVLILLALLLDAFGIPSLLQKKGKATTIEADQHNRIKIRMKGAKDVFYKTLRWANAKIRATCYRTGTGTAVSLAMSTIHHGPLFDLNLSFSKDHKWYFNPAITQDECNRKAFPVVAGSSDHHDVIKDLPIRPLTLVQGDTVWYIMRQFSLTSSTVDKCISSRCREITQDHALRESYETVLQAVDRMNLLPKRSDYNDARRNNNNDNNFRSRQAGGGRIALDALIGSDSDIVVTMKRKHRVWIGHRTGSVVSMKEMVINFELDLTLIIWMILLSEESLIGMIMENQQDLYHH